MDYKNFKTKIMNSLQEDWIINPEENMILKEDMRISIKKDVSESTKFDKKWIKKFPDKSAFMRNHFLCYNGNIIEKFSTISVEGWRADVPMPDYDTMTITQEQYEIGKIFNNINNYDYYLKSYGIKIRKDDYDMVLELKNGHNL